MVWSRTATVGPWRPPCPGSEVAGRQAAAPAASRPVGIGPAVRLLAGRRSYVDGLGALLTLGDVELDRLALVQGAIVLDGAGVHEHVGAGLGLDEAVALVGVEPLDGSTSHAACPPLLWEWLGGMGAGSRPPIPAAARMSVGLALLAASAAVAIAISAAAVVASGGTTSRVMRSWPALVTPIVWASMWRNQPTWTRRPSMATRRGAVSQASRLSATRVIGPREASRLAMRPGSSASGSRERGHQPPSTAPVPALVGSSCSRSPGGAGGRVGGGAVVGVLVAAVMSSAPFSVRHGTDLSATAVGRRLVTLGIARPSTWPLLACAAGLRSGGSCRGWRIGLAGWRAGLVGGAAEPVAHCRARPRPCSGRRPLGGIGGGGVGQELPDRPDGGAV